MIMILKRLMVMLMGSGPGDDSDDSDENDDYDGGNNNVVYDDVYDDTYSGDNDNQ